MNEPDGSSTYGGEIRGLSDRLVSLQAPIRILDAVKWDDSVREEFFANGFRSRPAVDRSYYDARPLPAGVSAARPAFDLLRRDIEARLGPRDPAGRMMIRMCNEYDLVIQMLEARGTPPFHDFSARLFGHASEPFHENGPSLVDLAALLDEALRNLAESVFGQPEPARIAAPDAVRILQERLDGFFGGVDRPVRVRLDDGIIADAAAGSDYIKIRADAHFRERDLRVLEVHEGWVHVGTTLNGRAQPYCTFLSKGTPSTTITQEGLALFVELVSFSSSPRRLRRVTDRIRAIHWAEQGASFLEIFERFRGEGRSAEEAYPTCVRVFRGSTPTGQPFTKDLSYSRGFIEVYNFVRLAVRRGDIDRIRLLFSGKLTLADVGDVADLHRRGLLVAPAHLPPQLADPSGLAAWMAYSNFLNRLDLGRLAQGMTALFGDVG